MTKGKEKKCTHQYIYIFLEKKLNQKWIKKDDICGHFYLLFLERLEGTEDQRMRGNAEAEGSSSKRSKLALLRSK